MSAEVCARRASSAAPNDENNGAVRISSIVSMFFPQCRRRFVELNLALVSYACAMAPGGRRRNHRPQSSDFVRLQCRGVNPQEGISSRVDPTAWPDARCVGGSWASL